MPDFSLKTNWIIPAPVEKVWLCLVDTESWPSWWSYVASVEENSAGKVSGINNVRRYHWRTSLPYHLLLDLRVIQIQPCNYVEVEVTGDLIGHGSCRLSYQPQMSYTDIQFNWNVRTCKPWMSWLAPLTRPVFIWNHSQVMKQGEQGLIKRLSPSEI